MTEPTQDRILVELTIAAPADVVWSALRDPATITRWFGWEADSLADEIDYIFVTYGRGDDAARILSFDGVPDRFEVEAHGETSILRYIRAAPAGQDWDGIYDDMIEGWISFVHQLKLAAERHDLAPRRTLYFSGARREGQAPLIAELGLSGAVKLPSGEAAGPVSHSTPFQTGVEVPGWGDGMLIAMDSPPSEKSPHGAASAILTLYGFDDDAVDALKGVWQPWWDARFETKAAPAGEAA